MGFTCHLCYEDRDIQAIGKCNHSEICYVCILKMRLILKNDTCPICKETLENVIFTRSTNKSFSEFSGQLIRYKPGILCDDMSVREDLDAAVEQHRCPMPECDNVAFQNLNLLKKHLKDEHKSCYCDVCLENNTMFLWEQTVFPLNRIKQHLDEGDMDQEGNLVLHHTYCEFCHQYYYNEEALIRHLAEKHFSCETCGEERRWRYFKDSDALRRHLGRFHYMCDDEECRQNIFIVFASAAELELHKATYHGIGNGRIQLNTLAGFHYGTEKTDKSVDNKKLDHESIDFLKHLISKQKQAKSVEEMESSRALPVDEPFDSRTYTARTKEEFMSQYNSYKPFFEQIDKEARKRKPKQTVYYEDIQYPFYQNLPLMEAEGDFWILLGHIIGRDNSNLLYGAVREFYQKKGQGNLVWETFQVAVEDLYTRLNLYPVFLNIFKTSTQCNILDKPYKKYLQSLPRANKTHVTSASTFLEVFQKIVEMLDESLIRRFREDKSKASAIVSCDSKLIYQLIKGLKRMNPESMLKVKFGPNIGITLETINVVGQLFTVTENEGIELFSEEHVEMRQVLMLRLYFSLCVKLLKKSYIEEDYKLIDSNIINDFFLDRPDVQKQFNITLKKDKKVEKSDPFEEIKREAADFPALVSSHKPIVSTTTTTSTFTKKTVSRPPMQITVQPPTATKNNFPQLPKSKPPAPPPQPRFRREGKSRYQNVSSSDDEDRRRPDNYDEEEKTQVRQVKPQPPPKKIDKDSFPGLPEPEPVSVTQTAPKNEIKGKFYVDPDYGDNIAVKKKKQKKLAPQDEPYTHTEEVKEPAIKSQVISAPEEEFPTLKASKVVVEEPKKESSENNKKKKPKEKKEAPPKDEPRNEFISAVDILNEDKPSKPLSNAKQTTPTPFSTEEFPAFPVVKPDPPKQTQQPQTSKKGGKTQQQQLQPQTTQVQKGKKSSQPINVTNPEPKHQFVSAAEMQEEEEEFFDCVDGEAPPEITEGEFPAFPVTKTEPAPPKKKKQVEPEKPKRNYISAAEVEEELQRQKELEDKKKKQVTAPPPPKPEEFPSFGSPQTQKKQNKTQPKAASPVPDIKSEPTPMKTASIPVPTSPPKEEEPVRTEENIKKKNKKKKELAAMEDNVETNWEEFMDVGKPAKVKEDPVQKIKKDTRKKEDEFPSLGPSEPQQAPGTLPGKKGQRVQNQWGNEGDQPEEEEDVVVGKKKSKGGKTKLVLKDSFF